jgi:hypothetical protein
VLVTRPFVTRPWALPVLMSLYRTPEWDRRHGARHKTPAPLARLRLARLMRWFPPRHFIIAGDSGYGTSMRARFCHQRRRHLTVISTRDGDAAWYAPPPPRRRSTIGRPRVKGRQLPSPQAGVAQTRRHTCLAVAWYGDTSREIEIGTGRNRDKYLYTTARRMQPQQIVEHYTPRWSIETTFQECRELLKLQFTKCYSKQTGLRCTPCMFGL